MNTDEQLLYTVSRLYYVENLSQVEISKKLKLSRPKVSRLLAKSRESGIVSIKINSPTCNSVYELEERIKSMFGLENVLVVATQYDDVDLNFSDTIKQAATYFQSFIQDGDKIGIAWGYTLLKLAENFSNCSFPNSSILQIAGNLDNADSNNFAHEIIHQFSQKLGIKSLNTLPCPVAVESSIIVDLLLHDSKISNIIDQINSVDVAFPNIGVVSEENCLWRSNYISTEELHQLNKSGSVGCVCCRFIDVNGNIVDPSLDNRTISISLSSLKNARHSCVCVCSEEKVSSLIGCLRCGFVNVLAIDSKTATTLLERAAE